MIIFRRLGGSPNLLALGVAKTGDNVIIYHASSLHVSIADGRADKAKTALNQVFAQRDCFNRLGWDFLHRSPCIYLGLPSDELPKVFVEATKFGLNCKESLGVAN
jgi:hypothetical protein